VSWFSLKWRASLPEAHLPAGRQACPGDHLPDRTLFSVRLLAAAPRPACRRQGDLSHRTNPEEDAKDGRHKPSAAGASVSALGSALGAVPLDATRGCAARERECVRVESRVPTGALSSAEVALHDTACQLARAILFRPGSSLHVRRCLGGDRPAGLGLAQLAIQPGKVHRLLPPAPAR